MKLRSSKLVAYTFMLLGFTAVYAAPLDEFGAFIEKVQKDNQVPAVAVVVVQDDKIVFARGYGVTNVDKPSKVDENTIFQLASVSKTFTSAAVALQVDQDKIDWDDEVVRKLPGFELKDIYATRYTTPRDLLAHRTGLPPFTGDLLGNAGYPLEDILHRIRFVTPANSFREKGNYSNLNFFIAGQLVAQLSGKPFTEAVKSGLLAPLKMSRTGFVELLKDNNLAATHAMINGKVQVIERDDSAKFAAAGGVFSTAKDLGNWMIMFLNDGKFEGKEVIQADSIREMLLPSMVEETSFTELPPIGENSGLAFGMGWDNYHYKGKMIVEKGGALSGVRSVISMIPEKKTGIAVVANLNVTVIPEIIRAKFLENNLGNGEIDIAVFDEKQKQLIKMFEPDPLPKNVLPARALELYTGEFENDLYGTVVVAQKGDKLEFLVGPAKWDGRLTHFSNDTFTLQWPFLTYGSQQVTFIFGPEGKAQSIQTQTLGTFTASKDES